MHRDWWTRLGGFDERYFMYGEDVDLSMRARAAGGRVLITPDATVSHVVGASSSRPDKLVLLLTGKVTLARTHFGRLRGPLAVLMLVVGTFLRGRAWPTLTRRPASAWSLAWERRREWIRGYGSPSLGS
jgi:GT2 family glycosyltransferase